MGDAAAPSGHQRETPRRRRTLGSERGRQDGAPHPAQSPPAPALRPRGSSRFSEGRKDAGPWVPPEKLGAGGAAGWGLDVFNAATSARRAQGPQLQRVWLIVPGMPDVKLPPVLGARVSHTCVPLLSETPRLPHPRRGGGGWQVGEAAVPRVSAGWRDWIRKDRRRAPSRLSGQWRADKSWVGEASSTPGLGRAGGCVRLSERRQERLLRLNSRNFKTFCP